MAISKILNMKDCGGHFHGKHLKRALDYVMNPDKTQDGRLVGAINCQVDTAFEQMKETKRNFGKIDKRQGYHIILSFKENEVNPDTAFEITQKFVEEYLGKSYEAVFVVHDNTAHVHSHIVFNSVSFVDGKKYRYEKGDWAKYIQPITNRLCQEYGLSIIDVDDEKKERQHESYKEWSEYREGNFVWSDMIKRDLDACILQAKDYEEFLELLSEKGYQIKQGKHLAIKPQGMTRFRRCKSLGDMYCEEAIRDRIVKEDIAFYKSKQDIPKVSIVKCRVKRYRRAGLSGLQKKHYAKLYRVGKLKKRPYSQVWKYREDIRKMHKLQEQYLFLARHNIHSAEELVGTIASLTDKKKETSAEKSRIYKARERSMELFTAADEMENLKPAEQSYRLGDIFFEDEHRKWVALEQELQAQGYSLEEVQALRRHYKEEYSEVCAREKVVCRELNTGKAILNSMIPDSISPLGANHPAVKQYNKCMRGAGDTVRSIIISANSRLAFLENKQVLRLLSKDELNLSDIGIGVNGDGETKTALFCVIPDSDKSYNFIIGMLYTQIFQELYYQADFNCGGRLPIHVTFMLDEFANVALPDDFCSLLSTMRSREISSIIIIQNFAQLKALFKDTWETIPGNCDTFIYLGGNEQSTHKYVSELLGKGTIDKKSSGETKGRQGSSSRNYDVLGRELFTPDEVRKLDNKKCIIFIRGFDPIMDNKYIPFRHPMFNQTADGKGKAYVHKTQGADRIIGPPFEILSEKAIKHYEKMKDKGENVYIDTLTYEQFMLLGDKELSRRFSMQDEAEQKAKIDREQANEFEYADESQKAENSDSTNGGEKPVRNPEREKPKWEDTITNRMMHWSYTAEQKEEVKKALAAGVPKATILTYFYPEVTVEKMSSYWKNQ